MSGAQDIPGRGLKRKRQSTASELRTPTNKLAELSAPSTPQSLAPSDIESDGIPGELLQHTKKDQKRNVHHVIFGDWQLKTWYFSPYPIGLDDVPLKPESSSTFLPTTSTSISATTTTPSTRVTAALSQTIPQRGHGLGLDLPGETAGSRFSRPHSKLTDLLSGERQEGKNEEDITLWVCDKCFKYMTAGASWELHMKGCTMDHPPGRKVYQRGAHTIWEVDGAAQKLYCQNLSLFGKFFIDVKTLFFDCENFMFYLMTDATSKRDHVLAFFSKEKVSYDDYNLACIVTFPPYQKKGYGMLLIEFSYELSRRAGKVGTPERPLSELGSKSYLLFWVSVLVRFFRKVLEPPGTKKERRVSIDSNKSKSKKSVKGWDGEREPRSESPVQAARPGLSHVASSASLMAEPNFGSFRRTHTNSSGTHLSIRCTLADIARATNLRVDDCAWAMREAGFLLRSSSSSSTTKRKRKDEEDEETFWVSTEMVEDVAREWGVKRMMMEIEYVKL